MYSPYFFSNAVRSPRKNRSVLSSYFAQPFRTTMWMDPGLSPTIRIESTKISFGLETNCRKETELTLPLRLKLQRVKLKHRGSEKNKWSGLLWGTFLWNKAHEETKCSYWGRAHNSWLLLLLLGLLVLCSNPQPGGPGLHIYIPWRLGGPVIPPGTEYPF
jgi:hypothetical protein